MHRSYQRYTVHERGFCITTLFHNLLYPSYMHVLKYHITHRHKATVMQYIGELCRYLLAPQPHPAEKDHRLRVAVGNGLRPEIWNEFQRRNNIPEIGEFYGATEGNAFLFNHCKDYIGQGAVGKAGPLLQMLKPTYVVKFDIESEEPIRDPKTGFCIEITDGSAGELVSPILDIPTAKGSMQDFEGYTSKDATEKKILRNVFKKGDSYFRTGDLLRRKDGFSYFVDRIGDTFRWKGENVSTMEVSEVISTFPGVMEASVYGVEVPGKDGRACMVAIRLLEGQSINAEKFAEYCMANLPSYSVWRREGGKGCMRGYKVVYKSVRWGSNILMVYVLL